MMMMMWCDIMVVMHSVEQNQEEYRFRIYYNLTT